MTSMKTMVRATPPDEIESLRRIVHFIKQAQRDEGLLHTVFPALQGSSLQKDHAALPELSLPDFVSTKLTLAYGHIDAFARWLGAEGSAEVYSIQALPFGGYALLRPVLECAGEALWLMKPNLRQTRLRRRMTAQADEILNAESYLKDSQSSKLSQVEQRISNLDSFAERLQLGPQSWSPWKETKHGKRDSKHAPISNMLTEVESLRDSKILGFESSLSWSAAWRACSGATHGQSWPISMLNDAVPVPDSKVDHSEEHNIFARFGPLAQMTHSACDLLATTFDRATELGHHRKK